MLLKLADGWHIFNQAGTKHLAGPIKLKKDALRRMGQIEYFKSHPRKRVVRRV